MRSNLPVTQNEIKLSDATLIVSKTDLQGRITYINKDFLDISGFTEAELIGQPHNIVRHPDMPPEAFTDFWETLKAGRPWTGLVKNRCKNGDYYWVLANATPIYESGQISGYMSVRRKASESAISEVDAVYRQFREKRQGKLRIQHGAVVKGRGPLWQNKSIGLKLGLVLGKRGMWIRFAGCFETALRQLRHDRARGAIDDNQFQRIASLCTLRQGQRQRFPGNQGLESVAGQDFLNAGTEGLPGLQIRQVGGNLRDRAQGMERRLGLTANLKTDINGNHHHDLSPVSGAKPNVFAFPRHARMAQAASHPPLRSSGCRTRPAVRRRIRMLHLLAAVLTAEKLAHMLHPWLGMATNLRIVFENLLNQPAPAVDFRRAQACVQTETCVCHHLVAQGCNAALQLDQAFPVVGPGGIHHMRGQGADFFVEVELGGHQQHGKAHAATLLAEATAGSLPISSQADLISASRRLTSFSAAGSLRRLACSRRVHI